jgi:Tfp pilus assembly protein PilN
VRAVNLIPGGQLPGSGITVGRSQGAAYAVVALVGGLALLALLYGQARRDVSSQRTHLASLQAQSAQAQAAAAGLAPYTNFISLREERERAVSALVDARFDWAHAFHELGRVLPAAASISSIDGSVGSSSASGAASVKPAGAAGASSAGAAGASSAGTSSTPPGSVPTITVNGCATSQAEVAVTLNRLRLIDGVSEVALQSSTKSSSTGSSASGSSGQCGSGAPAFGAVLTFDPLPSTQAVSAAVPVSSAGGTR